MHIAFFITFAFFEDIINMTINNGSVTKEQVWNLLLCQLDGFFLYSYF